MRNRVLITATALLFSACSKDEPPRITTLQPFTDENPIEEYVSKSNIWSDNAFVSYGYGGCPDDDDDCAIEEIIVTATKTAEAPLDSITNNQEEGVDEGDIVKRIGDHIVLMRRGRIFSFSLPTQSTRLKAIDYIDVATDEEDIDAWYDEILVHGRTIILIGYSYDIDATLIRKYELADDGKLSVGKSHFFTSSDYFSAENYATRLVDGNLVFYMPRDLPTEDNKLLSGEIIDGEAANVGNAFTSEAFYQPLQEARYPALHTLAICPLDSPQLTCSATGFVGPWTRNFYISQDAIYLWLNSDGWAYDFFLMSDEEISEAAKMWRKSFDDVEDFAVVYRVPIDGSPPSAVLANGWPLNQFSFRETNNSLQVMTRDSPWSDDMTPGVLTIPLTSFDGEIGEVSDDNYEALPKLKGYVNANRFVGDYLLYDDEYEVGDDYSVALLIKDLRTNASPMRVELEHTVERIEPVGDKAIAIGSDYGSALKLTTVGLNDRTILGQTTSLLRAYQADERSHSFNFRLGEAADIIGLPVIVVPDNEDYGDYWWYEAHDVHMTYFEFADDLSLREMGALIGKGTEEDNCLVSCTDWYGDSRPFFIDDRPFAVLGYELIEGYVSGATIHEAARADALSLLPDLEPAANP